MSYEDIEVFINKKDSTRWAKQYQDDTMPIDNYSQVLFKKNKFIKQINGYNQKLNLINKILIYRDVNNKYFAHVTSVKKELPTCKSSNDEHCQEICVATYINRFGSIILINHFDPIGKPHSNNYSIYPKEIQPYYEKYFTDYTREEDGIKYEISQCPHFHFNSALQTEKLGGQERCNAISIRGLIRYLQDLNHCNQKYSPLLTESFDMPFLTFYKLDNKYTYTSMYRDLIIHILKLSTQNKKYSKIANSFQRLLDYYDSKNPNNNIERIILDLKILDKVIKKFPNHRNIIAVFSSEFTKSMNCKSSVNELCDLI